MDIDLLAGTDRLAAAYYGYVGFECSGSHRASAGRSKPARSRPARGRATLSRRRCERDAGHPVPPRYGAGESDLPDVDREFLAETTDLFSGESIPVVCWIKPDVVVVHATKADFTGNTRREVRRSDVRHYGTPHRPRTFAANPGATDVSGVLIDAIAEVPYGAHPYSCPGSYEYTIARISRRTSNVLGQDASRSILKPTSARTRRGTASEPALFGHLAHVSLVLLSSNHWSRDNNGYPLNLGTSELNLLCSSIGFRYGNSEHREIVSAVFV